MSRLAVVDSENRFLRWSDRAEIHSAFLPHRSIQVLVLDSADRLIVQRRHRKKLTYPSTWDISCAGHVEEVDYLGGPDERLPEVYESVARRELEEELGISVPLERLGYCAPLEGVHYEHFDWFLARSDGPFTLQETEVEALRAIARQDWESFCRSGEPLTQTLRYLTQRLIDLGRWRGSSKPSQML